VEAEVCMPSLIINDCIDDRMECEYVEKEVDMGFFDNFTRNGNLIQSKCPCKCTCDCDRCALPFG
jgi:hypothetical protein